MWNRPKLPATFLSYVTLLAATSFFWGAGEAILNHFWPPKGTWWPDVLLTSTLNRVMFYAAAVTVVSAFGWGIKRLSRRKDGQGDSGRRWGGAAAVAAVVVVNAGWYVVGAASDFVVPLGPFSFDMQERGPFFFYWAIWLVLAAGLAALLAFAVGRRRWARRAGRVLRTVGAAACVCLFAAYGVARLARPKPTGPNVIIIVLDAWRGDTFRADLMPKLTAAAAKDAVVFEHAWSNGVWTTPAVATLFTGQYHDTHVMRQGKDADVGRPTLAQALRDAGYDTVAFSANRILNRDAILTDGFEDFRFTGFNPILNAVRFYHTNWYGPATRAMTLGEAGSDESRLLTDWIKAFVSERRTRPYFLWVHYMDPHAPYEPPEGYYDERDARYVEDFNQFDYERRWVNKRLYDGECRFMDDLLASLWPQLRGEERTITFITADHGEEFWEHGGQNYGHGKSVYEACTRVPLVVRVPGQPAGVCPTPVSLVDVAPTVMTACGMPPLPTMQGRPFLDAAGVPVREERTVYVGSAFFQFPGVEDPRRDAVIVWPYKLILSHKNPKGPAEFFDLAKDPCELRPLEEDDRAAAMRILHARWQRDVMKGRLEAEFGAAAAADLRALGYIQ